MNRQIFRAFSTTRRHNKVDTEIVLLHFGQPRTEYYAKEFVSKRAQLFYNLPDPVARRLPSFALVDDRIRRCIDKYGAASSFEVVVDSLGEALENNLKRIMPETGIVNVSKILYCEEGSLENAFNSFVRKRSQKLIFLPLYSHFWCAETGALLSKVAEKILSSTVPLVQDSRDVINNRISLNSDFSYEISAIHRWNSHPLISEYWEAKLRPLLPELAGIVFAVQRKVGYDKEEFEHAVWANCERVMTRLAHSVPWKIGYYTSWDSWNAPVRRGLQSEVKKLAQKADVGQKVAVVPITELMPTFDTFQVIPEILANEAKAELVSPDDDVRIFAQGLAEVVKNHLLGRKHQQLSNSYDNCLKSNPKALDVFC